MCNRIGIVALFRLIENGINYLGGLLKFRISKVVGWQYVICRGGTPILNIQGGHLRIKHFSRFINRQFRSEITIKKNGLVEIGKNVLINQGANIVVKSKLVLGDDVLIADLVCIRDHNSHEVDEGDGDVARPIHIASNAWIGTRAIILSGVNIGEHSVVAAGSVVTKDVPPRTLVAGNPAKPIREIKCSDSFKRSNKSFTQILGKAYSN